jgi:hypothetical protein
MIERKGTAHQGIADAPYAPKITRETVQLLLENLWGHIAESAKGFIRFLSRTYDLSEAEVDKFGN